ncbi:MAG TPA: glycosyltransferase family 87 protein, partial [Terriglobales bacterium]|nr:glycosyltransferase family 87 protein [Terriglobales bacterium]
MATTQANFPAQKSRLRILIVLGLAGMLAMQGWLFFSLRHQIEQGYPDFTIFYTAGKCLRQGKGRLLYDTSTQMELQRSFASGVQHRAGPLPYNHPPFEALLFAPLAAFPYPAAYYTWLGVNVLLLAAYYLLIRSFLPALHRFSPAMPVLATIAFFPVYATLLQGQDSILLLLLCTLAYLALRKGREFGAGVFLGLGLFRPQLALPLFAVLVLRKRWRAIAGFAATGGALLLVSAATVGWKSLFAYPQYVLRLNANLAASGIYPRDMPNLRGMLFSLMGSDSNLAQWLTILASAALVV